MGGHMFAMPFIPYDSLAIWLFKQTKSTSTTSSPVFGFEETMMQKSQTKVIASQGTHAGVSVYIHVPTMAADFDMRGKAIRVLKNR